MRIAKVNQLVFRSDILKGKNYSCNNTGKRNKNDFYQTPYSMTLQLIETGELYDCKTLLEPACGNNAIVKFLIENLNHKFSMSAYDINGKFISFNFLNETIQYDCIVTNPPFSKANEFILHAKKIATKKIIFLMPLSYLHGKNRFDTIWTDKEFPLKCVYIFTRYPLLENEIREDGKYKTGMQVYAWYVWDKEWKGEPVIR